jgi:hypothetical protein
MIPGVSCERCHGPARAHIEAAKSGALGDDLRLGRDPARWSAKGQLEFCGRCHRHPSRVPPERLNPDDPELARFQPIGLSQSRCYLESGAKMTCLSCHDPHGRSASDPEGYQRVCLNCHGSAPKAAPDFAGEESMAFPASACPVSSTDGCLGCHMPKVKAGLHVPFTDHWIRVRRDSTRP